MTAHDNADRHFDRNLAAFGRSMDAPSGPSAELGARCAETLRGRPRNADHTARLRRPALLSGLGLAASLALAFGLFFPNGSGPSVHAATVLTRLTEQIQGTEVFEVHLDEVTVDEVSVNGYLQLAEGMVAGDLRAVIDEGSGGLIEVDAALAIAPETGWVLVRKLKVPDREAQAFVSMLLPPGAPTLLILPAEVLEEVADSGFGANLAEIRELAGGQAAAFIKEVLHSKADVGADIRHQADGTVLLTIVVDDAEALTNLLRIALRTLGEEEETITLDAADGEELIGATLQVAYDPQTETVRTFSVSNIADVKGTITVSLRQGPIDPALLDSERVAGPGVRVLDISALLKAFGRE